MVNGLREGFGLLFCEDSGSMKYQGTFVKDKISGDECIIFNEEGNILYKGFMREGLYQGGGCLYHGNGIKFYEGNFSRGLMHSPAQKAKIYHDNGKIEYDGFLKGGKYFEQGKVYWKNGALKMKGNFVDGKLDGHFCCVYYANGMIQYTGQMKNGRYFGWGNFYYGKTGKLKSSGEHNYGCFKESKFRMEFFANGQIKCLGKFNTANELTYNDDSKVFSQKGLLEFTGNLCLRKSYSAVLPDQDLELLKAGKGDTGKKSG